MATNKPIKESYGQLQFVESGNAAILLRIHKESQMQNLSPKEVEAVSGNGVYGAIFRWAAETIVADHIVEFVAAAADAFGKSEYRRRPGEL